MPLHQFLGARPHACAIAFLFFLSMSIAPGSANVAHAEEVVSTSGGNSPPRIRGSPPTAATPGVFYTFAPGASDPDGDTLRFSIVNKPRWMWFDARTGRLNGHPKWAQRNRTFSDIVIKVSDGRTTTRLPAFSIRVGAYSPGNSAPTLSGTPPRLAPIGQRYYFKPTASDRNGDTLRFSIVNKPAWASFATATGALTGTPASANAGTYTGITISVSDGKTTTRLGPFRIDVTASTANRAPTVWGQPATTAQVSRPYAFKPGAVDADGDALTFSIVSKPAWARFDGTTGTLYGTPGADDVGRYSSIVIRVSDGATTAGLAPFGIDVSSGTARSVTLNWSAPRLNTDGSALTDLSGYRVYYGSAPRQYSNSVRVGASATSAVIDGLVTGTWYFAIKSINTDGVASDFSGEVRTVL
jgi:hypothetical protein